jgi:energy-coupling factor transport system permease protein
MAFVQDITLGQYYPEESVIHRLDPRSKLIVLLFLMMLLVLTIKMPVYLIFCVILLTIIAMAKLPFAMVFRNLKPFIWLFLITFFLNLAYGQGKIIWTIPIVSWHITDEAAFRALMYTFRIGLMIVFAAVFTLTTSPMDITDGLARLFSPLKKLKVPVQEFALMMTIAIRFIPLLLEEADRIRKAQIARGARFDGNLVQRIRSLIPLIIPLFISAFRKADDLALAMEARCYRIGGERTSFNQLKFRFADYSVLVGAVLLGVFAFSV